MTFFALSAVSVLIIALSVQPAAGRFLKNAFVVNFAKSFIDGRLFILERINSRTCCAVGILVSSSM